MDSTEKGQLVVEAEWISGTSLEQLVEPAPSPGEATRIIGRLALALGDAHARGLLHLDLKPRNVFLRENELSEPVLTDFIIGEVGLASSPWQPPECASGQAATAASDVYLLGRLALWLLAVPDQAQNELQLRSLLVKKLSLRTTSLLLAAIEKEPHRRPDLEEIQELARAAGLTLETAGGAVALDQGRSPSPESEPPPNPPGSVIPRVLPWKVGAGAAVIVAVLLLFYLLPGSGTTPPPADAPQSSQQSPLPEAVSIPLKADFSWQVLTRPGEGEPAHHPHTLVLINDFNLFVLRHEAGYPSTVLRAQAVAERLGKLFDESDRPELVRFSVETAGQDYVLLSQRNGTEPPRPILTITAGDVEGYNRRSHGKTTTQELAIWYRQRLLSFWDVFVNGRKPSEGEGLPEAAILSRIARTALASSEQGTPPLNQRLEKVLDELSGPDRQALLESVFTLPETPGDDHHDDDP